MQSELNPVIKSYSMSVRLGDRPLVFRTSQLVICKLFVSGPSVRACD